MLHNGRLPKIVCALCWFDNNINNFILILLGLWNSRRVLHTAHSNPIALNVWSWRVLCIPVPSMAPNHSISEAVLAGLRSEINDSQNSIKRWLTFVALLICSTSCVCLNGSKGIIFNLLTYLDEVVIFQSLLTYILSTIKMNWFGFGGDSF